MKKTRYGAHFCAIAACIALLSTFVTPAIAQAEEEFTDVYRLGRSATRFSSDPAIEFENFQQQFADYRADFEKVLSIAGWDGNVDALFATVENAKEGEDGAVRFVQVEHGKVLPWMALRRKGAPAILENMRWAAKVPFPAWEITVEDGDRRSIFVVPQWCMNLSLDHEEKIVKKVEVKPAPAPAPPPPPSPECRISATVDENGILEINASASRGEVELTGLRVPDGSTADLAMAGATSTGRWTFDTNEYVGRKPGDYTFNIAAVSRLSGQDDPCETSVVITKAGPDHRWIARGFGGTVKSDAENVRWATILSTGSDERQMTGIESGTGFGFGLEYLVTENWGVDARVLFAQLEGHWMYDLEEIWLMDEEDLDYFPITIGVNYHFTPRSVVDVYAGAFIGYANFGSVKFSDSGVTLGVSYDSSFMAGLALGLDIPFGDSPWIFTGGLTYAAVEAEAGSINGTEIEFDVNPVTAMAGIGYRF